MLPPLTTRPTRLPAKRSGSARTAASAAAPVTSTHRVSARSFAWNAFR